MLNGRFKLQLAEKHSGNAKMVLRILAPYCSSDQIKLNNYLDKRTDKTYYNCSFKTKALPTFTKLHKIWYKDNTKIIPANIKELLTPISLAHWIMQDGSFQKASGGVYLCTDSYTILEVKLLATSLSEKFNIKTSIHISQGRGRIYIWKTSMEPLRKIVRPHFHDSMLYRIGL